MSGNARETALEVLTSCRKAEAWADGALKSAVKRAGLDSRDAALAARITYGVLQNRALLDYYLRPMCKNGDLEPVIRDILRIGAVQILWMDRIPHSAAVNASVELAKSHGRARAAGMVNAVLRRLSREKDSLKPPADLSIRYSHPEWLVERFREILGEETEAALAENNQPVPTTIQHNPLRCSREELEQALANLALAHHSWLDGCYTISGTGDLEALPAFQAGDFLVQDAAAALAARAAGCRPGDTVIDVCAAPGGKSFAAAIAMENRGRILSFDLHAGKLAQIQQGAQRLGISIIETAQADGRIPIEELSGAADVVLCDVPCSGLGIIRKKPDIRYKDPAPLKNLPGIQLAILRNAAGYVKPGGVLLYSTCTILPEENQNVVDAFLADHPEFGREETRLPDPIGVCRGDMTLWPHRHQTDGFYLCKLRKHHD